MIDCVQTLDDVPETYAAPPQAQPQYQPEQPMAYQPTQPTQPAAQQPAQPAANAATWNTSTFVAMVTSPGFLKAVAAAFVVVFVVCAFPVEDFIFQHIPLTKSVPNSVAFVKAVVSALVITSIRPPAAA
jgi:hypothetical protein